MLPGRTYSFYDLDVTCIQTANTGSLAIRFSVVDLTTMISEQAKEPNRQKMLSSMLTSIVANFSLSYQCDWQDIDVSPNAD